MKFTASFDDDGLVDKLRRAVQELEHRKALLDAMGAALEAQVAVRFETKRDPSGNPWDQLRPSTAESYTRRFHGKIPGTLLDRSFDGPGMRSTLSHRLISDTEVEVGLHRFYAAFHEFGTKHMVRRGMFFSDPNSGTLGADDQAELNAVLTEFLNDVFGA